MALNSNNHKPRPHRKRVARDFDKLHDNDIAEVWEVAIWADLAAGTVKNYVRDMRAPEPIARRLDAEQRPTGPNHWLVKGLRPFIQARREGNLYWRDPRRWKGPLPGPRVR